MNPDLVRAIDIQFLEPPFYAVRKTRLGLSRKWYVAQHRGEAKGHIATDLSSINASRSSGITTKLATYSSTNLATI